MSERVIRIVSIYFIPTFRAKATKKELTNNLWPVIWSAIILCMRRVFDLFAWLEVGLITTDSTDITMTFDCRNIQNKDIYDDLSSNIERDLLYDKSVHEKTLQSWAV